MAFKTTEQKREYDRQYHAAHREHASAVKRANYQANKEREHARTKQWRAANPRRVLAYYLKRYDLTVEQYDELLAEQGGVCAICKGPSTEKGYHVDHDHVTKRVRGLLCSRCNVGLGQFKDSPDRLRVAVEYLEKNRAT